MDTLENILISIKEVNINTENREACNLMGSDCVFGKQCLACRDCILDYRANLDKQINILNKLRQ